MIKKIIPYIKIFSLLVVLASGTRSMADPLFTMSVNIVTGKFDNSVIWNMPEAPDMFTNGGYNLWGCVSLSATSTCDHNSGITNFGPIADLETSGNGYANLEQLTSAYWISNLYGIKDLNGNVNQTTYIHFALVKCDGSFSTSNSCNHYDDNDNQQLGYAEFIFDGVSWDSPETFNDNTRIITLEPENNSIATSTGTTTNVIYNFVYYINEDDIGETFSVQVFLKNYDQNTLFGFASDEQIEFLDFVATSSGIGGLTGSISLPDGNYMIKGQLKKSLWGFTLPKIGVLDEKENQFIVGSSTYIGALIQGSRNSLNNALASTSAMSFASSSLTCSPVSSNVSTLFLNPEFSPISCLAFLFVPDSTLINDSMSNLRINVLQSFPIGYVTDFVSIMATTSTSTLTVIDATLPSILPGGGARIQLNLSHALDWALYSTSSRYNNVSASSTRTFFAITNDYWKIVVYVGALLYILSRLLGTRLIPNSLLDHNKQQKL